MSKLFLLLLMCFFPLLSFGYTDFQCLNGCTQKGHMYQFCQSQCSYGDSISNLRINCDKYPADYCVVFYGSEVISVFNFVVGTCALCG
jgi:hypothetical protein